LIKKEKVDYMCTQQIPSDLDTDGESGDEDEYEDSNSGADVEGTNSDDSTSNHSADQEESDHEVPAKPVAVSKADGKKKQIVLHPRCST
jgi:hypothetical protein